MNFDLIYNADFVFTVDATASMERFIYALREYMPSFEATVRKFFEDNEKDFGSVRVRFVIFRDIAYDPDPLIESDFFNLPEDTEEMMAFLEHVECEGGGDKPESALEALALAINSEWREARGTRQTVVVFTDADAHPIGKHAWHVRYPEGMPESNDGLRELWEKGGENGCLRRRGRLVAICPASSDLFTEICEWDRSFVIDEDPSEMSCETVAKYLSDICEFISF